MEENNVSMDYITPEQLGELKADIVDVKMQLNDLINKCDKLLKEGDENNG